MGGKSTTSTQTVSIPPEVMARYNAVNARAEDVAATPFQPYSGKFVAPLSPTQQAGVQNTNVAAGQAQPYYGAATGLTLAGAQDVGALTPGQISYYQNPYTQAVVDPTVQALRQQQGQQLSQQQSDAIRAGAFGGDRSGIQRAVLQGQQGLATAQAIAPLYQQGYGQAVQTAAGQQGVVASDLARRMQAGSQIAGLGAAAQQAAIQGAQAQLQAGGVEQQTQQADLTAQYQQFLQQRGYPFQVAQFLANIAMGTGALSGSTTTTEQPSGLFSDKRLKHDTERVGYTDDGLPIYTFKYNGDNKTQMGVMAQDVEKKHPDAVGEAQASDGQMYKTVDYGKLDAKERAYGGGLDPNSMGGAVMESGAFARGGFLGGGLVGDTEMKSMMANMKQPLGMYQQAGLYGSTPYQTPYGPGLGIRGDAVPVPSLVTAGSLKSPPPSALQQATSAYKQMSDLGQMGSGLYDFGERVAVGRPEIKDDKGKVTQEKSSGLLGSAGKYDPKQGWLGSKETAATGGLVGRLHYDMGGDLPYSSGQQGYDPMAEIIKQGQQQHYELAKPGQLPKRPEPLKDAMQTGMQMYSAGKMGSKIIDKGKELVDKMGSEPMAPATGQVQTDITAMPVARPTGLGAAPVNPDAPAAGAKAVEATQATPNVAGTYTIPGSGQTVTPGLASGAEAPTAAVAETMPESVGAAAAPAAETVAAAAPEALGAAEGATALAGGAEALGAAGTAAAGAEEALPFLLALLKRGGRVNDHHYAEGGLVPRHGYANEGTVSSPAYDPEDLAIRTIAAETGGDPDETKGIAAVIKNRLDSGKYGKSLGDVVLAKGQFEPWANPAAPNYPMRFEPGNKRYEAAKDAWNAVQQGDDPTGGATHFWAPAAQKALGRAAPSWGQQGGVDIGATRFHKLEDDGGLGSKYMTYAPQTGGLGNADALKAIDQAAGKATGLASYFPTKKDDTGAETTDWKKILIPLATGIAGVAGAPTRNLGTALALGIGAGAKSYADIDKQQADIAYREAETGKLTQETQLSMIDRLIKINQVRFLNKLQPIKTIDEYMRRAKDNTLLTDEPSAVGTTGAKPAGATVQPAAGTQPSEAAGQPGAKTEEAKAPSAIDWNQVVDVDNIEKMGEKVNRLESLLSIETDPDKIVSLTKQIQDINSRIKDVKAQPSLLLKSGEKITPPSWAAQQRYEQNLPEINKTANQIAEKQKAADVNMSQLDNIEKALGILQSGALMNYKTDFARAMNAAGFPVSDKQMSDVVEAQKVVKDAWNQIFAKAASLPGTIRNLELQGEQKASNDISIEPGANKNILVNGKAGVAYERQHAIDWNKARLEQGARFDPLTFENQWRADHPQLLDQLKAQYTKDIALMGDTPVKDGKILDYGKLKEGHSYIITPDMITPMGQSVGIQQPTKFRAERGPKGNIVLNPVQ